MIRAAKHVDTPRIIEMMEEMQAASKYAGRVEVDADHARKMLMAMIHRHGHTNDGGCLVNVVETEGAVTGFMIGMLDRIYHMGTKLAAKDVFLHVTGRYVTQAMDASRLIDAYCDWACSNPKVIEINLSWTDTLEGAGRIASLYFRKGFTKVGEIFERSTSEAHSSDARQIRHGG